MLTPTPGVFVFGDGIASYVSGPEFSTNVRFKNVPATTTPNANVFAVNTFACQGATAANLCRPGSVATRVNTPNPMIYALVRLPNSQTVLADVPCHK